MDKRIKTNWWLLFIVGVIFLILAFKVISHPAGAILDLAFFIGWAALISGVFQVIFSISVKAVMQNWAWRLVNGIFNIVIGILFLSHPAMSAEMLPFLFGFWMIFIGIITFFSGIREQNSNIPGGWFEMLLGVIIFIGGVSISYYPAQEAPMLLWFISFTLFFYGIYFIIISLKISKIK